MVIMNRCPHDGSGSVICIGEGPDRVEIEILEVEGKQVIVGVHAPHHVRVTRKEVAEFCEAE